MEKRRRYIKRSDQAVTAIQLDLETGGFSYTKWGAVQKCKQGDWLLNNNGDIYTVDADTFSKTYRKITEGRYVKITPVWAEQTERDGSIKTKEGESHFNSGDYLVFNNEDGSDGYCMTAESFQAMYQLDEN